MGVASTSSVFDAYRHDLAHVTQLTPDEEKNLARAWAKGDNRAGDRLVEASLPFVIKVAKEYRRWGIPFEDLVQQGNLGLLRAAEKFDPEKDCRLITYAVYWIRAEIRDYVVRSYRIVRLGTTRTERRALRSYRRSRFENPAELAEASGMPLARCEMLWPLLAQGDVSLDMPTSDDNERSGMERLVGFAPSPEDSLIEGLEKDATKARLQSALQLLPERENMIVRERVLRDDPRTLEDLGRELGVSKERVRQLEERAFAKLRQAVIRAGHEIAA